MRKINKVFLFYPPGPLYQRGEDRSQGNISYSTATAMRAPNDMAYVSAELKKLNIEVFFKDYASEKLKKDDLEKDFIKFNPDIVLTSTTNSTIDFDIEILNNLKKLKKEIILTIKGAIFFKAPVTILKSLNLNQIDFLIGGEVEFAFKDLVIQINSKKHDYKSVTGIFFRNNDGEWNSSIFENWNVDIDDLEFPDRSIINNKLYIRPDTGEPQATIATSRGCPASCIYCLTPSISGKKVRFRSPDSIVKELEDCYFNYGIKNFFFKSDTFTIDKIWVTEVCNNIKKSKINNKISWVANSRVRPLELETLTAMKSAGCWLVAFGFESGSDETLKKIKKGATVEDNLKAAQLTKKAGLKLYGFYLVGLPWENLNHLKATEEHIFKTQPDFLELHIAVPYYGTELFQITKDDGLLKVPVIGQNYFEESSTGTAYLSSDEIIRFRRKVISKYHFQFTYIMNKLFEINFNPMKFYNYFKYGLRLIKNLKANP